MKNLIARGLSGALFVAVIVLSVINGFEAPLFLALEVATQLEFYLLLERKEEGKSCPLVGIVAGVSLFLFSNLLFPSPMIFPLLIFGIPSTYLFVGILILTLFLAIPLLELYKPHGNLAQRWANTLLGIIYVALPFACLSILRGERGAWGILLPLIFIWCNDIGAFVIGSLLGKHKLAPGISPKKSWEGFVGGLVITMVVGFALIPTFGPSYGNYLIVMPLAMGLMAVLGDLVESMLKRHVGVKDSGNFLPGHGGFLDRFDAMLFALPMAAWLGYFL